MYKVVAFLCICIFSGLVIAKPLIGITQIVRHPALDATVAGIQDTLLAAGYEAKDLLMSDAGGNPSLAAQIAKQYSGRSLEAVIAVGTTSAMAFLPYTNQKTPIFFASVTDPLGAKLVDSLTLPTTGMTGVSNMVSPEAQLEYFLTLSLPIKTIGMIYNPGENNSIKALAETEKAATALGLKIISVSANRTAEVMAAASVLAKKVDAIFINNDNTALAAIAGVVKAAEQKSIPVFASDVDTLESGVLAVLGPDQYALGCAVAKMMMQTLEDKEAPRQSVSFPERLIKGVNCKQAKVLGISFSETVIAEADKLIE